MRGSSHSIVRFWAAAAVASASVACSLIYGLDGYSTSGDGAGSTGDAQPDVRIVQTGDGSACACVGAPPVGWQGPASLWEGAGAAPECGGDYPAKVLDAFSTPDAPDPVCGCTCAAPTGVTCPASFTVDIFNASACPGTKCDTVTVSPGACVNVQANCFNASGISGGPTPSGGACTPTTTQSTVPPWSWRHNARTCVPARAPGRGSCDSAEVCAPLPAAPMVPRPCIFTAGDLACPAGAYSVKHVYYADADDHRACTPCTCGAPTGATCTATLEKVCGSGSTLPLPTACTALGDPNTIRLTAAASPSGGTCAPSGGAKTGALTPTGPTTVCCVP